MNRHGLISVVVVAAVVAFGCAKKPVTVVASAPPPTGTAAASRLSTATPTQPAVHQQGATSASQRAGVPSPARRPAPSEFVTVHDLEDIHFDFDKYAIRPADAAILDHNVTWLKARQPGPRRASGDGDHELSRRAGRGRGPHHDPQLRRGTAPVHGAHRGLLGEEPACALPCEARVTREGGRPMASRRTLLVSTVAVFPISVATLLMAAHAQMTHMGQGQGAQPAPIRITMDKLHANGGVPRGWMFLMPRGDASEGRKVFVSLECFACHEVKGEEFPQPSRTARGTGPELTGMGSHHPAEYFAESIMNPNRVIVLGSDYTGSDGLSKMPDYSDDLTVRQLANLVAYLKSLTGPAHEHGEHAGMGKMKM
jgi:mono/diheme cytochrome c family protein